MSDSDNEEKNESSDGGSILDNGGIDTDERAGRSLGIEPNEEPDEDTKQEIEEVRQERLDPDNRPDGAEIDNSDRTFDATRGQFTDSEDYDDSEPAPFVDEENPNTGGDDDDSDDSDDSTDSAESADSADSDDDDSDDDDSDDDSDDDDSEDKASEDEAS